MRTDETNAVYYRANVVIAPVKVEDKLFRVGLTSPITTSRKEAEEFGEKLFQSGAIVGYRVVYSYNQVDWYFHEKVRYHSDQIGALEILKPADAVN